MSVKNQINDDNLHPGDGILTWKLSILSIVNTLKIIIPIDVYDTYISHYYNGHHVDFCNMEFTNIKLRLNEL